MENRLENQQQKVSKKFILKADFVLLKNSNFFLTVLKSFYFFINLEVTFLLAVPVDKKKRHAEEEEDKTYNPSSTDDEETPDEDEEEETEDEESGNETDGVVYDEEELSSTSKTLKDVAEDIKKTQTKKPPKQKLSQKSSVGGKKKRKEKTDSSRKKQKKQETEERKDSERREKTAKPTAKSRADDEVNNETATTEDKDGESKTPDKDGKKEKKVVVYNDKNVDFNLYNEAPEHIKNVKIKISSNVLLMCRMIEANGAYSKGLSYDYAALSFVRNSKDGKSPFEFNLPLSLAPNIVKGIQLLVKNNPRFFEKQLQTVTVD